MHDSYTSSAPETDSAVAPRSGTGPSKRRELARRDSNRRGLLFYRLIRQATNAEPQPLRKLLRPKHSTDFSYADAQKVNSVAVRARGIHVLEPDRGQLSARVDQIAVVVRLEGEGGGPERPDGIAIDRVDGQLQGRHGLGEVRTPAREARSLIRRGSARSRVVKASASCDVVRTDTWG